MIKRWRRRRLIGRIYEETYQRRLHAKRNYDDWWRHGVRVAMDF